MYPWERLKIEFINQIWRKNGRRVFFVARGDRKKSGMINNPGAEGKGEKLLLLCFSDFFPALRDFIFHLDIHCLRTFISSFNCNIYIYIGNTSTNVVTLQLYIYCSSLTTNEEIDFVRKRLRKKENVKIISKNMSNKE